MQVTIIYESVINCIYFWSIHNPVVELQSNNYLGIMSGLTGKIGGSFRDRDHFRVNLGTISGLESFWGRDHFGGLKAV